MNRWKEAFEKHPVHETLSWLDNAASSNAENLSEGEVEEQRRLKKIIERYRAVLSSIDPEIVPVNQLDSLNNQLRHQNITNQVNAYLQNGKPSNLVSVNDQVSKHLTQLSLFQSLSESSELQDKTSYIDSVVDSTINGLAAKKEALEEQLDNVESLTKEQTKKLEALSEEIKKKQVELTNLSSDWQNQFSASQESRSQEFSKWRDAFSSEKSKEVQDIIDKYSEILDDQSARSKDELDKIIVDSKLKHQSILDLYELTAGDSVGAAYIKSADDERGQANLWRGVSVGFIVITVVWLVFSFFYNAEKWNILDSNTDVVASRNDNTSRESSEELLNVPDAETQNNDFPWHIMLIAFSISGVLLWGAAYSAQQSTKHRNNEKRARWFALEVKAFDPFISSLEPQQQQELKRQLAERIFGQNSTADEDSKVVDEHALRAVTDAFGKVLSKLPK
ncbi:hypothetical protein [Halomonas marinisediminis]|uniref:Uncharacterized protein n=1 Tax=Halomonas marinisediminis TaxID=2546095 RepID=A0ABY2D9N2_9GAMM|nr:hypothetical protein [Halomonas marinisediminis]TDB04423.1 hypothetical protein E0702_05065 [Halomonas marinisediminis]